MKSVGPVFCDSSVLVRYFAEDDPPRAVAAARLIDGDAELVVSTGVILEVVHVLRTEYQAKNPELADLLIAFLSRANVRVVDADKGTMVAALRWSTRSSARRIPDAILAAIAESAECVAIVTFDEAFTAPTVPVRLL